MGRYMHMLAEEAKLEKGRQEAQAKAKAMLGVTTP